MPRLNNIESVNCYAAALDFLTNRYCQPGSPNGRIHHFIMHNEVDQGVTWTNMGKDRPVEVYLQNYYESMRIAYNVLREYDENGEVRSEEHTSELQSRGHLVCRLLLEKKKSETKYNVNR